VIRKYVREGQYVEEGTPLYDVADLSTVWIQAQVYEDDMAFLPAEQAHGGSVSAVDAPTVTATTRAFPNEPFTGKLAFVYPHVDQDTRTVMVRFELANPGHKLRPGSTATVTLRISAKDLRAFAAQTADRKGHQMLAEGRVLAVPETAVIDTGSQSIVYREAEPGVYEGVRVTLGPRMVGPDGGAYFPVFRGLAAGERVVASGAFLVDAETRLNPAAGSIYFGSAGKSGSSSVTVRPSTPEDADAKIAAALARLSPADRKLAEAQRYCPVLSDNRLGVMGVPVKLSIEGQTVFVCCSGCKKSALADPRKTLEKVEQLKHTKSIPPGKAPERPAPEAPIPTPEKAASETAAANTEAKEEAKVAASLAALSDDDRPRAAAQRYCAVLDHSRLGAMGAPVKLTIKGQTVFLCCDGCREKALANPQQTLRKLARRQAARGNAP
jgi:hypothetical protein